MFKKKINKKSLEWLYSLEILCFLNEDKIYKQLEKLKENRENDKEKDLINYYESIWNKIIKKFLIIVTLLQI